VEPPFVAGYQFVVSDLEINMVYLFLLHGPLGRLVRVDYLRYPPFLGQEYNKSMERAVL
jgi:hypothetical protein